MGIFNETRGGEKYKNKEQQEQHSFGLPP